MPRKSSSRLFSSGSNPLGKVPRLEARAAKSTASTKDKIAGKVARFVISVKHKPLKLKAEVAEDTLRRTIARAMTAGVTGKQKLKSYYKKRLSVKYLEESGKLNEKRYDFRAGKGSSFAPSSLRSLTLPNGEIVASMKREALRSAIQAAEKILRDESEAVNKSVVANSADFTRS